MNNAGGISYKRILTTYILNNLRILKGKNPGDNYYDEYLRHFQRDGEDFADQYLFAIENVMVRQPKRILEIGVRTGLSLCNMLSAYIDHSCIERIVLVDQWADSYASPEIVKMNLRAMNFPVLPIEFIVGDSLKEVPKLEGEFDYILVDGDHDKKVAAKDLRNVVRLCALGGVIVFDDISEHGCDLMDVFEAFHTHIKNDFECGWDMGGKGTAWAYRVKK